MSPPVYSQSPPVPDIAGQIDALLPQTQCTRCGYPACRPYADAIASGEAAINRCPPGGTAGIAALADLLGKPVIPLDPQYGQDGPRLLARIESEHCIGCTKCIVACPVDAIIGGPRFMHTVLPALCTGCELCVPPCPVDCIRLDPLPDQLAWTPADSAAARTRFNSRAQRRQRDEQTDASNNLQRADQKLGELADEYSNASDEAEQAHIERKQRMVRQAIDRARQRQADRTAAKPGDVS